VDVYKWNSGCCQMSMMQPSFFLESKIRLCGDIDGSAEIRADQMKKFRPDDRRYC